MKVNVESAEKSAKRTYEKPELLEIVLEDYTEGKKLDTTEVTTVVGPS